MVLGLLLKSSNKKRLSVNGYSKQKNEVKQRIRIRLKAYDHRILDKAAEKIIETAIRSGASAIGPIPLPTQIKKMTVLRSTFIHKDSREQYEMRIHKRLIDVMEPSGQTIDLLMNLDLPSGVDIEIKT